MTSPLEQRREKRNTRQQQIRAAFLIKNARLHILKKKLGHLIGSHALQSEISSTTGNLPLLYLVNYICSIV